MVLFIERLATWRIDTLFFSGILYLNGKGSVMFFMKKYNKLLITITILLLLITVHNFNNHELIQYKGYETKMGDMLTPRKEHFSMLIDNNNILTVGGDFSKNSIPYNSKQAEIYNIHTKRTKLVHPVNCSGHLTLVKKDNRILVLGGNLGDPINGKESVVEEYNPQTQKFSILHKNNIRLSRSPHLVLNDGNIYVYNSEKPYIYNPITNKKSFTTKSKVKRWQGAYIEIDNNILLSGGTNMTGVTNFHDSIELYNRNTNSYKIIGKMQLPRHDHRMIQISKDKILIVGGRGNHYQDYLDDYVFKNNLDIKQNALKAFYRDLLQDIELYDLKTNKSKIVGQLNYSLGENLILNLIDNKYVLVTNGMGKHDEVIDINTFETFPVKIYNKVYRASYVKQLDNNTVLRLGGFYKFRYKKDIVEIKLK